MSMYNFKDKKISASSSSSSNKTEGLRGVDIHITPSIKKNKMKQEF